MSTFLANLKEKIKNVNLARLCARLMPVVLSTKGPSLYKMIPSEELGTLDSISWLWRMGERRNVKIGRIQDIFVIFSLWFKYRECCQMQSQSWRVWAVRRSVYTGRWRCSWQPASQEEEEEAAKLQVVFPLLPLVAGLATALGRSPNHRLAPAVHSTNGKLAGYQVNMSAKDCPLTSWLSSSDALHILSKYTSIYCKHFFAALVFYSPPSKTSNTLDIIHNYNQRQTN